MKETIKSLIQNQLLNLAERDDKKSDSKSTIKSSRSMYWLDFFVGQLFHVMEH